MADRRKEKKKERKKERKKGKKGEREIEKGRKSKIGGTIREKKKERGIERSCYVVKEARRSFGSNREFEDRYRANG